MSIRDLDAFVRSQVDWELLDGCFGPKIMPSDIDGGVERYGTSLFLEHKLLGGTVTDGQGMWFRALARQGNSVIAFWTKPPNEFREVTVHVPVGDRQVHHLVVHYPSGPPCEGCGRPLASTHKRIEPANADDLRRACADWFETQERRGHF